VHASELEGILNGSAVDRRWPPHKRERDLWARTQDYRRRYENDQGVLFSYRPDLHVPENAPATYARQQVFTPQPTARNLAKFSASLLFSEPPKINMEGGASEAGALQAVLEEWLEFNRFWDLLVDAGDTVAAEGSAAIRVMQDDFVNPSVPIVTFHGADSVLWSERHDRYNEGGILIISLEEENSSVIWRLLESHAKREIRRVLYKGGPGNLGKRHALTSGPPQFRELRPMTLTGVDPPTLVKWENVPGAHSDLAGLEPLLDALDEAYTVGRIKMRASQPVTFLRQIPYGSLKSLGGLPMHNLIAIDDSAGGTLPEGEYLNRYNAAVSSPFPVEKFVETAQPGLEADQHRQHAEALREQIVTSAGYDLASWGLDRQGRADSGTALRLRQSTTLRTRAIKERMAVAAIKEVCALAVAMMLGQREVAAFMPETVELSDGMPRDRMEDAQEISQLRAAGVISLEEAVRRLNPGWEEDRILEEVAKIEASSRAADARAAGAAAALAPQPAEVASANGGGKR
jgi:Phage portal protein, SPP1 Gp6-like